MNPQAAKTRFLERLGAAGLVLAGLTPAAGVEAMLDYYAEERADECDLSRDGDMLLYQWGTHDWGEGPSFQVDITRQLIVNAKEKGEQRKLWQLSLRFHFDPSAAPANLKSSNKWCPSPKDLPAFRQFVSGSRAIGAVGEQTPVRVELRYNQV